MIKEIAVECLLTSRSAFAGVAQWQSNGFVNRRLRVRLPSPACGQMSEWLKETGCKLVGESLHWFESSSAQTSLTSERAGQLMLSRFRDGKRETPTAKMQGR